MKKWRITKIVKAISLKDALKKEGKADVSSVEEVIDKSSPPKDMSSAIGFQYFAEEEEEDEYFPKEYI